MHDLIVLVLRHLRAAWRFRWYMLSLAWVCSLVGWFVVAVLPDQFDASARVYVDTQSVLKPVLRGLAIDTGNSERKVALMTKTLLSRPNLEKVMRMTDMDLQAKTPEDQEKLLDDLKKDIRLSTTKQVNLYTISYRDESPELAKLVVKSLLTIFMEGNLGEARKEQDSAQQFLEQQIQEYERRMVEAEENLKRFKQRNIAFLGDKSGDYYSRLAEAKGKLKSAELELKVEKDRLEILRKQLAGETPSFGLGPEPVIASVDTSAFDQRIAGMENRLDEMLLRFTDKHPDIVAMKDQLSALKKERAAYVRKQKSLAPQEALTDVNVNPVYQQMRMALSQAEANVAAKSAIVEEYANQVKALESAVDRALKVETEQGQLNRDYGVLKKNHAALLARLESARLSNTADSSSDSVQFKVIDPPRVPLKPSAPNRILLSILVFFASLGVGLGLAFLLSQLRPTFDDRGALQEATGLPVLGSVDMVWTSKQRSARKRRNWSFAFAMVILMAACGAVISAHVLEINPVKTVMNKLERLI